MSSIAEEGGEQEVCCQGCAEGTGCDKQEKRNPVGWNKSAGKNSDKKRGPQCNYILYRGKNSGDQCPRNGFHEINGKVYCTNHYRTVEHRTQKLKNPKRKAPPERQIMEDYDSEETLDSQAVDQPSYSDEEGEVAEPPQKKVRQLTLQEEEKEEKPKRAIDQVAEIQALKQKYKQKYQAKYQKPEKKAPTVWDTYKKKPARKTLNSMMKFGGGVSPLFTLPHE